MDADCDAVVIGAGQNGLVAANRLAERGWSVLVLEAGDEPGGAVRSGEITEPGFTSDLFSSFYPLAYASPAMRSLGLERHGLRWTRSPVAVAHPQPDGACAAIFADVDETAASLERFAPGDGDAWRELYAYWERAGGPFLDALLRPFPPLRGGARLGAHGGRLECGTRVARVIVRGGRAVGVRTADGREIVAGRAVLATTVAPTLYRDLVGEQHLPAEFLADLRAFQFDNSTVKVDWSLDGPIPWTAEVARRAGTVHVADGIDALTRTTGQLVRGLIPDQPFLVMGQYSMVDPTRQPPGRETAWAYTHVPQAPRGDAGGELGGRWDERETTEFAGRIEAEIERRAPGFRQLMRARHVFTPPSLEVANSNLVGGAVNQSTAQIHQELVFRPAVGLGRAETPVRGLYLAGASAHPGGGVHGAGGANAARAALRHDLIRSAPGRRPRPRRRTPRGAAR